MRSRELKLIKVAEICHGKKIVDKALNITTQDIKYNRVNYNKTTGPKEFMSIFKRSLNLCLRCC